MKRKILLVDDDNKFTSSIKNRLTKPDNNYEITSVNNGTKCFGLLDNNYTPDLILLDVTMPDLDGIDVFKKLKENPSWKKIPTVFLIDDGDGFNEFFVNNILHEDYIVKPFDQDVFVNWLKKRIPSAGG